MGNKDFMLFLSNAGGWMQCPAPTTSHTASHTTCIHLQLGRQLQPVTASHLSCLPPLAALSGGFLTPRGLLWCQEQPRSMGKLTLLGDKLQPTESRSWWIHPYLPVLWWMTLWELHVLSQGLSVGLGPLPTAAIHWLFSFHCLTFSTPSVCLLESHPK